MNKKIYILKGSEDGLLGAYGNAKQALKNAINYLKQSGELVEKENDLYKELCKTGFIFVEAKEDKYGITSAEITLYYLNTDLRL